MLYCTSTNFRGSLEIIMTEDKSSGKGNQETGRLDPGAVMVFESPRCLSKVLLQQLLNILPVSQTSRSGYFWNYKPMFEKITSMDGKPAGAKPSIDDWISSRMWNLLLFEKINGKEEMTLKTRSVLVFVSVEVKSDHEVKWGHLSATRLKWQGRDVSSRTDFPPSSNSTQYNFILRPSIEGHDNPRDLGGLPLLLCSL